MSKIFTNKKIWKIVVIAILVIMAVQVIAPTTVFAAEPDDAAPDKSEDNLVSRGILMRPIISLLVSAGDGVMSILHSQILGQENSLLPIDLDTDLGWIGVILGAVVGIIVAILIVAAVASGLAAIGAIIQAIGASVAISSIGAGTVIVAGVTGAIAGFAIHNQFLPNTLYLPAYTYSAEEIFKGNILLFNVNFFDTESKEIWVCYNEDDKTTVTETTATGGTMIKNEEGQKGIKTTKEAYEEKLKNGEGPFTIDYYYYYYNGIKDEQHEIKTSPQDSAVFLRKTISSWYTVIRNICIVGMLSILVYVGIKIILSSVANDKAKYREMLKDWLVGLCLLFVMHYIMAFSVTMVERLTYIVKTSVDKNFYMGIIADKDEKISKAVEGTDLEECISDGYLYYPTNLMGYLRLEMQKVGENEEYIGYVICFLILVIFTVVFTFTYLKRLLYMAFLTIIAPLVALTYPIDKINDGQAQGFNTWLKEYIFNLLIQPMHLLLYFILVTSAIDLAGKNVIYSLVALGFMLPAEKLLRSMFGFEKAKTPPLLGGPAGTALMMQGINGLSRIARGGKIGGIGSKSSNALDSSTDSGKPRTASNMDDLQVLAEKTEEGTDKGMRTSTATADADTPGEESDTPGILLAGHPPLSINRPADSSADTSPRFADESPYEEIQRDEGESGIIMPEEHQPLQINRPEKQTEATTVSQEQNQKPVSSIRRLARTAGTAAASQFKSTLGIENGVKGTLKNNAKRLAGVTYKGVSGTVKRLPGAAIGLAAGAAAATIGGTFAVATGDPKNIVTAAGTAVGVGASVGSRITGTMTTTHLDDNTKKALEAAKQEYNSEEYKEQDREKAYQEAKDEDVYRIKAKQILKSDQKVEEFMGNGGNMQKWMHEGETDFDDMLAMQQLVVNEKVDADEARATMGMLRRVGNKDPKRGMGDKEQSDLHKTIVKGITRNNKNVDEERAGQRADEIEENMSRLHQYRYR
ncbi:MAG: hypothetical protein IKF17_03580 [Clostridia bacterium]|nr:hypothetical protein [Clostridia bacterium]